MILICECQVPAHCCGAEQQIGLKIPAYNLPTQHSALLQRPGACSKTHVAETLTEFWDLHLMAQVEVDRICGSCSNTIKLQREQCLQVLNQLPIRIPQLFLYCQVHYLLGLSAETKKVLDQEDKMQDDQAGFCRNSECLAYRYICMACDCFGPRGDDKNGCRDSWLAYCMMVEQPSTITRFRDNRVINCFQAAFHCKDINDYLQHSLQKMNKKLQVLSDCQSEVTDCHVIATRVFLAARYTTQTFTNMQESCIVAA